MTWVEEWPELATCRGEDPDALFVQGAAQQQAKVLCRACPVRTECLAQALDTRTEFGVWGGLTERERRQLLRDHPEVLSWKTVLQQARQRHEASLADTAVPAQRVTSGAGRL
ncbi:WhiB family transcriptional regulator [Aquipuribacter sp. SD81]|uniref:WhiB family transcriptional regulator n=1 Tax=Aquipuribacter sp. SD81 TaxID=3127703 RepID=UPI003018E848